MATTKQLQKQYEKIWNSDSFDPWQQQVVVETKDSEMVIQLDQQEKVWYLIPNPQMKMEEVKGLEAIHEKVGQMITEGKVESIYIDCL